MSRRRYLVTSALPYINGVKHLGNLVGSMLPADVYARFLRAKGEDVVFICGTDEHGTPAEVAAAAAGLDVGEYCRLQHEIQAELSRRFDLSFDRFGRTSSPANHELTKHFADALTRQGYIEERTIEQLYSPHDGRFLPDRYVEGTCPYCGYEAARGDQCENCTRLLDPLDLLSPRSAISGATDLEVRSSKHLFFLQSKLADEVREWLETKKGWPILSTSIAFKWLTEGVQDRSITRDLSWGVPVDRPGMEGKVYYVWFDAPFGYIAATKEWSDADSTRPDWKTLWSDPSADVYYVQFMAKDNVPFHTIGFPASLIGTRESWKLVDYLKAFNWLTYYGGKFSTSQGRGVFMDDALELLPADYWRYYLIANAPESDDSVFTWELFAMAVNKDLADTFGNFVNRALTLTARAFDSTTPSSSIDVPERALAEQLGEAVASYTEHLENMSYRKAAQQLRTIWAMGNAYLNAEAPWKVIKTDRDRAGTVLAIAVNLVRLFAVLSTPIIPATAAQTLDALGAVDSQRNWPVDMKAELATLPGGHPFTVPPVLFRKVTPEEVDAWRDRFGGSEPDVAEN